VITEIEQPLAARVAELMPGLTEDLVRLAGIPSIAFSGFPPGPVREAYDLVVDLLAGAGVSRIEALRLPDTPPVFLDEIPAPDGAPTMLLYADYDVQPPGDEGPWRTPPFEPTKRDGAIYARAIADDNANVIAHVGALRAHEGRPPVGVKIVIEGREEYGSPFDTYPPTDPDRFRADAIVVGDAGNILPGVAAERLGWGPALTITGVDARRVDGAVNAVVPFARARLNLRVHPEQSAEAAQATQCRHLERVKPFGISLGVTPGVDPGGGFAAKTSGPGYEAARVALARAWDAEPRTLAGGGSIPLVSAFHEAVPDAEILLFGAQGGRSDLHRPNERVLLDELERAIVAEAEFFREYAGRKEHTG
jgi:acetylornithine deacetylase/succinyl-diaminopimelate desuccinylase-like protein